MTGGSQGKTLSICLIVKDEEAMLSECLASISNIADQIVVVDTGSTDSSIEIAKQYNAEIHHFEWCQDFAAARNESIKFATMDWILWIDADERLTPESRGVLSKILKYESKPVIYRVRIKNLKEDGVNFTWSDAHRLFTNSRGIRFSGKIHEQISPSAKKIGVVERDSQIVIDHLGYSFTGEQKSNKQDRNRSILEKEVEENPDNAYMHYTLAHNYKEDGHLEKAREQYHIALELDQFDSKMTASLQNTYADTLIDLGLYAEALTLIQKSLALHSRQNAAHFLDYKIATAQQEPERAIAALKLVLEQQTLIEKKGTAISTDIEVLPAMIWKTLADLYSEVQNWNEASKAYKHCISLTETTPDLLKSYFKTLENLNDWRAALEVLGELIKLEGESTTYLNAIGTILIRLQEFQAALQIFLRLNEILPDDESIKKRIASLFAKTGQFDKAREWLSTV